MRELEGAPVISQRAIEVAEIFLRQRNALFQPERFIQSERLMRCFQTRLMFVLGVFYNRRVQPGPGNSNRITDPFGRSATLGYDVRYEYQGREFVTRLGRDPGRFLRVRIDVVPVEGADAPPPPPRYR